MGSPVPQSVKPVGRPRRLPPDVERARILEAALTVMQRSGFADASVSEILSESGLSTGSFYRHFDSKDDLLLEMYHRDAGRAAELLSARVERVATPLEGVRAWVDEILGYGYSTRKRQRVAVMGSPVAQRAAGYREARQEACDLLVAPLQAVLAEGGRDGTFPSVDPENDARTICSMAFGIVEQIIAGVCRLSREQAVAHLMRFCDGALGVSGAGGANRGTAPG